MRCPVSLASAGSTSGVGHPGGGGLHLARVAPAERPPAGVGPQNMDLPGGSFRGLLDPENPARLIKGAGVPSFIFGTGWPSYSVA